ncbi:MAG: Rrf2 family transcriptional regulator [Candidatus Neomarinimicrobiota bacterium]
MLYSKSAQYAIQALIGIAAKQHDAPVIISDIAQEFQIPQRFLSKIVQILANHGLVKTYRGRHGGVMLARLARDIKVSDIVEIVDGPVATRQMCVIGLDICDEEAICPFHTNWMKIRQDIQTWLDGENLENLANVVIDKRQRLRQ